MPQDLSLQMYCHCLPEKWNPNRTFVRLYAPPVNAVIARYIQIPVMLYKHRQKASNDLGNRTQFSQTIGPIPKRALNCSQHS